jgi:hypothetical protein
VNAESDEWSCYHFSQSNPLGHGQGDPAALLRRVADSIDALGPVWVQDIVYHAMQTTGEEDLTLTVYYAREPRPVGDT